MSSNPRHPDFLETLGNSINASWDSVGDALVKAEEGGFDCAILDVNLKGEAVWPVAEKLSELLHDDLLHFGISHLRARSADGRLSKQSQAEPIRMKAEGCLVRLGPGNHLTQDIIQQ